MTWLWGVLIERVSSYLMACVVIVIRVWVHSAVLPSTNCGYSHCIHWRHSAVVLLFSRIPPCRVFSYNCSVSRCRFYWHVFNSGSCAVRSEFIRRRRKRESVWSLCYFGSLIAQFLGEFMSHFSRHRVECVHLKVKLKWLKSWYK